MTKLSAVAAAKLFLLELGDCVSAEVNVLDRLASQNTAEILSCQLDWLSPVLGSNSMGQRLSADAGVFSNDSVHRYNHGKPDFCALRGA